MLDGSGSIDEEDFIRAKDFIYNVMNNVWKTCFSVSEELTAWKIHDMISVSNSVTVVKILYILEYFKNWLRDFCFFFWNIVSVFLPSKKGYTPL